MNLHHTPMVIYAHRMDISGASGRFSAACALYWYCVHYHGGQNSDLYRIQCALRYRPGMCENGPEDESVDAYIYADLQSGELDPEDVAAWIKARSNDHD